MEWSTTQNCLDNFTPSVKAVATLVASRVCTNRSNYLLFTDFSGVLFNNQFITIRNAVLRTWQENRWLVVSQDLTSHMDDWLDLSHRSLLCSALSCSVLLCPALSYPVQLRLCSLCLLSLPQLDPVPVPPPLLLQVIGPHGRKVQASWIEIRSSSGCGTMTGIFVLAQVR